MLIAQGEEPAELDQQFLALRRRQTKLEEYPSYPSCEHPNTEPRQRTLSNGTVQIVLQCLRCGRQVRPVKKDEADLRLAARDNLPFDPEITTTFEAQWKADCAAWKERREDRSYLADAAWWGRYNAYLNSARWWLKRQRRLGVDRYQCQADLDGCTRLANEVHHLTYEHVGNEPLFDLISVCPACHAQITAMNRDGRQSA